MTLTEQRLSPLVRSLRQHPRRWMAGLGVVLMGTGVTAFGIAPLAPDAANLPVRQVIEAVSLSLPSLPAGEGLLAAPEVPLVLYRSDYSRRDDTVQSLLQRLGVNDSKALAFLRQDSSARELLAGKVSRLVSVEVSERQELLRLQARWVPDGARQFKRLVVERQGDRWVARTETGELQASVRLSSGTIRSSLFAATDEARLPDSVANQLAELFGAEIDFRRDLQRGDRFHVVYETLEADGEVMRHGRLLSAEFVNNGKSHQVLWFQEPGSKGGYYNFKGESLRRAFLSSPLEFSRVSSGYGMRFHPISGDRKPHLGVDYAAPTGTPVRSVADGTVEVAGWQGGYGNVVIVRHANNKSTAYAHLSRVLVRKGQRVAQGERVGAVGSTGSSTGPHLHFEYRIAGAHRDPLTIAREASGEPIAASARTLFDQTAQAMRQRLVSAATVVQASAD